MIGVRLRGAFIISVRTLPENALRARRGEREPLLGCHGVSDYLALRVLLSPMRRDPIAGLRQCVYRIHRYSIS